MSSVAQGRNFNPQGSKPAHKVRPLIAATAHPSPIKIMVGTTEQDFLITYSLWPLAKEDQRKKTFAPWPPGRYARIIFIIVDNFKRIAD